MSRRLPSTSRRPRVLHQPTADNPYQTTSLTIPLPLTHTYNPQQNVPLPPYTKEYQNSNCGNNSQRRGLCNNVAVYETEISDDTATYYDYNPYYASRNTDCIYSEDESTTLPYYECRPISPSKRFSRTDLLYHGSLVKKETGFHRGAKHSVSLTQKDFRKIYPNHEGTQRSSSEATAIHSVVPHRTTLSRLSDRPQSSLNSDMTSAVVDGCGGHCQTFENACYYFLQVAFTMGILIGTSLSIAGAVLRKSAARNLQVLVYIGALLCIVSALLLAIQCSARYSARKRKRALRSAKRISIPLDTLNNRPVVVLQQQQQQPLMGNQNQRGTSVLASHNQMQGLRTIEHQGIPWWRRKDLV